MRAEGESVEGRGVLATGRCRSPDPSGSPERQGQWTPQRAEVTEDSHVGGRTEGVFLPLPVHPLVHQGCSS